MLTSVITTEPSRFMVISRKPFLDHLAVDRREHVEHGGGLRVLHQITVDERGDVGVGEVNFGDVAVERDAEGHGVGRPP